MAIADEYLYKVQVDNLKLTDVTRRETYDVNNRWGKGVRTATGFFIRTVNFKSCYTTALNKLNRMETVAMLL